MVERDTVRFHSARFIPSVVAGGCSLIRPFANVVRLEMWCGKSVLHVRSLPYLSQWFPDPLDYDRDLTSSQFFGLVCSLSLLESLEIGIYEINKNGNDRPAFQPLVSPPLTRTLVLNLTKGMEHIARGFLGLPNGIHFRRLWCAWNFEGDFQWTTALVEGCSDTLEYLEIYNDGPFFPSVAGPAADLNSY